MNPASKDIATILAGESSLALTAGVDLFHIRMVPEPDDCVVVLDNPGGPPLLTLRQSTSNYYHSSVTVYVRNTDYETAWEQAFDIMTILHGKNGETVASTYYALIRAQNDPQLLRYDENDRPVVFVNYEVQRRNA